jgi:hypothetical protein
MAMRSDNERCAEPDAAWLNDIPKPSGKATPGVAPSQETIPTPPAKAGDGSTSNLGEGFKLQPASHSDEAKAAQMPSKPELGEGFKLESHATQGEAAGTDAKPALKGLEPTPGTPALLDNSAPSAPGTGNPASPAPVTSPSKSPTDTPFVPEPTTSDAAPAALPALVPASSAAN